MSRIGPTKGVAMRVPGKSTGAARKGGQTTSRLGTSKAGGEDGYLYVAGIKDPSHKVAEFKVSSVIPLLCPFSS